MKEEWEVSILLTLFCLFLRGKPKALNDEKNNSVLHISDNGD